MLVHLHTLVFVGLSAEPLQLFTAVVHKSRSWNEQNHKDRVMILKFARIG